MRFLLKFLLLAIGLVVQAVLFVLLFATTGGVYKRPVLDMVCLAILAVVAILGMREASGLANGRTLQDILSRLLVTLFMVEAGLFAILAVVAVVAAAEHR